MKRKILFLFVVLFGTNVYSQEPNIIYYDANWKVIQGKENASFYRKVESDSSKKDHFLVKDFYISGQIQMESEMTSVDPEIMDGNTRYFFKSGKVMTFRKYVNGKENGYYKQWYENGQMMQEGLVQNNVLTGEWKDYYSNGKLRMVGMYSMGKKSGLWKIYGIAGKYYLKKEYKEGAMTAIELLDASEGLTEYYTEVDSAYSSKLVPYVDYKTKEEYKLVEPLIKDNLFFLQISVDFNVNQLVYPYTMIWLTNCPYLGKFEVQATKFMVENTIGFGNEYKYADLMSKMYMLGLGSYFLENKGKIIDLNKYHQMGAEFMINYYLQLKKIDATQTSEKMEKLLALQQKGKLAEYIKRY